MDGTPCGTGGRIASTVSGSDRSARLGPPARPSRGRTRRVRPIDLNAAVEPIVGVAIVGLLVAVAVLLVLLVFLARQVGALRRRLDGLTRGATGRSLDAVLDAHIDKVYAVARELDELSARAAILEGVGRRSIQRVGLVRYNPFEDTGGNQSFALALTDGRGDGFVISSLHARDGHAGLREGGQRRTVRWRRCRPRRQRHCGSLWPRPAPGAADGGRSRERVAGPV